MDRFGPSMVIQTGDNDLLFDSGRGAGQRLLQPFMGQSRPFGGEAAFSPKTGYRRQPEWIGL